MSFHYPRRFVSVNGLQFRHLVSSVGAIAVLTLSGCAPASVGGAGVSDLSSSAVAAVSPESPAEELRMAHGSVALYTLVKDGEWSEAQSTLGQLKSTLDELDMTHTTLAGLSSAQLSAGLTSLDEALANRDREAGMRGANQLVLASASLVRAEAGAELSSILMLGYYGRSLEMDVMNNSPSDFETTADELQYVWQQFRPDVAAKAGMTAAAQGDALIARLQSAESNADYGQVASELVALSSRLESLLAPRVSQSTPN